MGKTKLPELTVGRAKIGGEEDPDTVNLNVRMGRGLRDRLAKAARALGVDTSSLVRMMLTEKLPEYEARGRAARGESDA